MNVTFLWRPFHWLWALLLVMVCWGSLPPVPVQADTGLPPIAVQNSPYAIAVNPVTGKVYVVNNGSNSVTVINGVTHSKTTVGVGTYPQAIAVNPVTNKVYVANYFSVTIIDGVTQAITNVNTDAIQSRAVAVNSVTNKVYVANYDSNTVTVLDGATLLTTAINVGDRPIALAVNPVTNKIYIVNYGSSNVTVLDGATLLATTVAVGAQPVAVSVDPATNKIYVASYNSNTVTVINGITNGTTTVAVGTNPQAVAVNPVTHKVYVANYNSNTVTVIDSGTNLTTTVTVGANPRAVAVNAVTNKIYVTNYTGNTVTVIDGLTHGTTTVATEGLPRALAVNPVLNRVYVANYGSASVTAIDGATNSTLTLGAGNISVGIAVNPVTDRAYIVNNGDDTLTVLEGTTSRTSTFPIGRYPNYVVANPVTNKIYVSNLSGADVTVVDGVTQLTTTVAVGTNPYAMDINPVTNQIYVANNGSANVTVIDGASNITATVGVGNQPYAVAVNPVTNKVYVANYTSNTVTVIDGATLGTLTVTVGTQPMAVAVNPVTNKIYVANYVSNTVTVIDGATNGTATVTVGTNPIAVAVNPLTNKIYVANKNSANVTVIDGVTQSTIAVGCGGGPQAVAVNLATNQVYVANEAGNNVTVIDGALNTALNVPAGAFTWGVAVNPLNNKVYVANRVGKTATVLTPAAAWPIPLTVGIAPLPGNVSRTAAPTFTLTVLNQFLPYPTGVQQVYYQVDTWQGQWLTATYTNHNQWVATAAALPNGIHVLYTYATDGQDASSANPNPQASPVIGTMAAYLFLVRQDRAPVTAGEIYTTPLNTPLTVAAPGVLGNDSDPDGDPLQVTLQTLPAHGTVVLSANGGFIFVPTTGFVGQDTVDYIVADGLLTATARVTVTVVQINHVPVAAGDVYTTPLNTPLTVTAPGVLGNDSDADGNPLTAALLTPPVHGTLGLNANGSFTFVPLPGFAGSDLFDYVVSDGALTATARVTLTVVQINQAPVAASDAYTTPQDTALSLAAPGVLGNDSDADGNPLTAALLTAPAHGAVAIQTDGAVLYLPTTGFVGADSFTYLVSDGALTATGHVTVTVTAVNHPVSARDDIAVTREDTLLVVATPGVLANDSDPDGGGLTAELFTNPFTGSVTLAADGAYTYTPPLDFNDVVSFTYRVRDAGDLSATATVYILVQAVNDAPSFVKGADQTVNQSTGAQVVTGWATALRPGPANESRQTLTFALTNTNPALFSVQPTVDVSGTLRYTPAASASGVATVTVTLKDNGGTANGGVDTSVPQTFIVTVTPWYQVYLPLIVR
ncbi:PE-PGRS family protein PE_PGRS18 [Thermoflexales bacterium]|nr:PE-PGRS family protein PE_PGRS18 [Thermoflexales bacterium]